MTPGLFGTDGIRGSAGEWPVNEVGEVRLGTALGELLGGPGATVCLGRDSRPSGRGLLAALSDGLRATGTRVVDCGLLPTPAVAQAVAARGAAAGVAVSASHNPAGDNGFKLFGPGGEKLTRRVEARLEVLMQQTPGPTRVARGRLSRCPSAAEQYVDFALGTCPPRLRLEGLRIVVDGAWGAAGTTTPRALERLGAQVTRVCCEPHGERINAGCGSLYPERLRQALPGSGALGLAHDGDGDRLVLLDERGELLCGDRILGLGVQWLRSRRGLAKRCVVGTILTNLGLERWLATQQIRLHRAQVGDRFVWQQMRRAGAALGGEPSGHTIFRRWTATDDGLVAALQILALYRRSGVTLHELAQRVALLPQVTTSLPVRARPALQTLPGLARALAEARRELQPHGRVIVRYSGTEPVLRILVEGPNEALLQAIAHRLEVVLLPLAA